MSHFIRKCVCGRVITQCRCMSRDKEIQTVSPCLHQDQTVTVTQPHKPKHAKPERE